MPSTTPSAHPVFVGGTGRSGTTIAGELIGASRRYALVPIELRLHVDQGGLVDLAHGKVGVAEFEANVLRRWYVRKPNRSGPRGVHVIIDRPAMDQALADLRESHADDPWLSAGRFLDAVMQPLVDQAGASSWVEMTPPNAKSMHSLSRMLPHAKFVHMIRDGRDVASSVARRTWGPNDVPTAVTWWGDQMLAIRESAASVDPGRILAFRLESLVGAKRAAAYAHLADFLGLADDTEMQQFFDTQISHERARPGSWRARLSPADQVQVEALYEQQLARLEAAGAPLLPVL